MSNIVPYFSRIIARKEAAANTDHSEKRDSNKITNYFVKYKLKRDKLKDNITSFNVLNENKFFNLEDSESSSVENMSQTGETVDEVKRGRGRPRKIAANQLGSSIENMTDSGEVVKRQHGRSHVFNSEKNQHQSESSSAEIKNEIGENVEIVKRKRGRPRKIVPDPEKDQQQPESNSAEGKNEIIENVEIVKRKRGRPLKGLEVHQQQLKWAPTEKIDDSVKRRSGRLREKQVGTGGSVEVVKRKRERLHKMVFDSGEIQQQSVSTKKINENEKCDDRVKRRSGRLREKLSDFNGIGQKSQSSSSVENVSDTDQEVQPGSKGSLKKLCSVFKPNSAQSIDKNFTEKLEENLSKKSMKTNDKETSNETGRSPRRRGLRTQIKPARHGDFVYGRIHKQSPDQREKDSLEKCKKMEDDDKIFNIFRYAKQCKTGKQKNIPVITIRDDPDVISIPIVQEYQKLWVDKYQSKSISDCLISTTIAETARHWLATWNSMFNNKSGDDIEDERDGSNIFEKGLFISGPSGVGKTFLVYLLANKLDYQILEYNASMQRITPSMIQLKMSDSCMSHSLNSKSNISSLSAQNTLSPKETVKNPALSKSLLLLDDFDLTKLDQTSQTDLWRSLHSLLEMTRKPLIITSAIELSNLAPKEYCKSFKQVQLKPFNTATKSKHLLSILKGENIISKTVTQLNVDIENFCADHDLRQVINHYNFWYADSSQQDERFVRKITDHNMADNDVKNRLKSIAQLSMEDVYQNQMDLLAQRNQTNFHFTYGRHSLLEDQLKDEFASLGWNQSFKLNCSPKPLSDEIQIDQLVTKHYFENQVIDPHAFADYTGFIHNLSAQHPDAIPWLTESSCSVSTRSLTDHDYALPDFFLNEDAESVIE